MAAADRGWRRWPCALAAAQEAAPAQAKRAVLPGAGVPHRRLRAQRRSVGQRLRRLPEAGQRARRRHQRRQDHLRGVRDRLRHRPRRRVLRAPEEQEADRAPRVQPLSTGITFALTDKAPTDKIPLITAGYGRADSVDGDASSRWNFPLVGTYWDAADMLVQHVGKKEGGLDKLKGKKIALVYHDSPYGKEPIALLQERAKMHGFELLHAAGDAPGRGAEGHLAADPPAAPGLRVPVGLGRDEFDLHQGSGRHRLSAREDVRRVVVRRRARRDAGRRAAPRATTRWCSSHRRARARCTRT